MTKSTPEQVLAAVRAEKQRCERTISALADEMKDLGEPLRFLGYLRRAWDAAVRRDGYRFPPKYRILAYPKGMSGRRRDRPFILEATLRATSQKKAIAKFRKHMQGAVIIMCSQVWSGEKC